MGYTMYIKVLRDEYAARISNLQMYDAVRSVGLLCTDSPKFVIPWVEGLNPAAHI